MRLYENYIENIKNVISRDNYIKESRKSYFDKSIKGCDDILGNQFEFQKSFNLKPLNSLEPLIKTVGEISVDDKKLGEHPDFKYLKDTNGSENHYITSAFIDIKNSTGLFRKYTPETVMVITNTIQRAAIHTCVIFGGYIQRLQGDGVFVYFGGRNVDKKESIIKALTAISFFSYFVKHDLKNVFKEQGVENIYTRIGIDFGDDDKVLWSVAGVGECSEVTTYSLHTSLASKMQSISNANGVVVGDNVRIISLIDDSYFGFVRDSKGEIKKKYIFEDRENGFYYKPFDFKWYNYLKNLPYIIQDLNGELHIQSKEKKDESERLYKLQQTAALISSGNAYTEKAGNISSNSIGVKNQEHRFHYDKKD